MHYEKFKRVVNELVIGLDNRKLNNLFHLYDWYLQSISKKVNIEDIKEYVSEDFLEQRILRNLIEHEYENDTLQKDGHVLKSKLRNRAVLLESLEKYGYISEVLDDKNVMVDFEDTPEPIKIKLEDLKIA